MELDTLSRIHEVIAGQQSKAALPAPRPGWLPRLGAAARRLLPVVVIGCLIGCVTGTCAPAFAQTTPVTTFYVNSTADGMDASPGDHKCSTGVLTPSGAPQCTLRAAIDEANADSSSTTPYAVSVPAGTYSLSVNESCRANGFAGTQISLCVTGNVQILGAGQGSVFLDGGQQNTLMIVTSTATALISKLTIQNGKDQYGGAGILDNGSLSVQNVTFTLNSTVNSDNGSAIYNNYGTLLSVSGCTFTQNTGGVIEYTGGGSSGVSIDTSYFANNTAGNGLIGGSGNNNTGNNTPGTLTISNSTFANNNVSGDYVIAAGQLTMTNTTLTGNSLGNSTLIGASTAVLNNVTVYNNTAGNGPYINTGNGLTLSNSIIDSGNGQRDLCGTLTDLGHNIIGNAGCESGTLSSTTQVGIDPKLSAPVLDGGTVPVVLPIAGSPAIAAGSTAAAGGNASGACSALDENGKPRGVYQNCSIGAAEPLQGFQVNHVMPLIGGAGGNITMEIAGFAFAPGTTVALKSGNTTVTPQAINISADTTSLAAAFSLKNVALGTYDIVVTTPSNGTTTSTTLPGAFTVATATATPSFYSYLTGPVFIRAGRPATYTLTYGNNGNTDAYLVPLTLQLPGSYSGGIAQLQPPPTNASQVTTDFSSVSEAIGPLSASGLLNLPLLLPVVPAGQKQTMIFTVQPPSSANHGDPFTVTETTLPPYSSNMDTGAADAAVTAGFATGAAALAQSALGVTTSSRSLASMQTYAASQPAQEVENGEAALLATFGATPIIYDSAQLSYDIATYGANQTATGNVSRPGNIIESMLHGGHPLWIPGLGPPPPGSCTGAPLAPGTSCGAPFSPFPDAPPSGSCPQIPLLGPVGPSGGCGPPPECSTCSGGGGGGNVVGSVDPNLKSGPIGYGAQHYTQASSVFPYLIEFENEATASAPAQTVSVTDQLDTSKLDVSTFQLGEISFGAQPYTLTPPAGATTFQGSIDLRPSQNIIVNVTASLNTATGLVTWNFTSLDPATVQLTTDPTAGFLPPDTTPPAGIGHVAFTINPLASVADAAQICNTATVVFDTNSPINTAQYCNIKDVTPPSSSVTALPSTENNTSFTVSWTGTDTGSGVASYTIYSAMDGGAFTSWLTTAATSATFTGIAGHTYSFYSIATDGAGNVEAAKSQAEASTYISVAAGAFTPAAVLFAPTLIGSTTSTSITLTSSGGMPLSVSAITLSDTANFTESDNCVAASPIAQGASCSITVTFAPTSSTTLTAPITATVSVTSNAPTAPVPAMLTATVDLPQSIWIAGSGGSVARFTNAGLPASPSAGFAGGGIGLAVDAAGDVWSAASGLVAEFDRGGSLLATFSSTGIQSPASVAIDGLGVVWIAQGGSANDVFALTNAGAAVSATGLSTDGVVHSPASIAVDTAGSLWIANSGNNTVTEIIGAAAPIVTPTVAQTISGTPGTEPQ